MFIGHYAVAMGMKKADPKVSLGTYVLAAQLLDYIWPALVYFGVEHVRVVPGITAFNPLDLYDFPISHSLMTSLIYSMLAGGIYFAFRRRTLGSVLVGFTVFSHWLLDFITHRPDLPVAPGINTYLGLGLWNSYAGSIVVEITLYVAGLWLYLSATKAKNKAGIFAFWPFAAILPLMWVATMFAQMPDASPDAIGIGGLVMLLFVPWAYWINRNREAA